MLSFPVVPKCLSSALILLLICLFALVYLDCALTFSALFRLILIAVFFFFPSWIFLRVSIETHFYTGVYWGPSTPRVLNWLLNQFLSNPFLQWYFSFLNRHCKVQYLSLRCMWKTLGLLIARRKFLLDFYIAICPAV